MSNRFFLGDSCILEEDEILRYRDQTIGGDGHRHMLRVSINEAGIIIQDLSSIKIIVDGIFDVESLITKIGRGIEQK